MHAVKSKWALLLGIMVALAAVPVSFGSTLYVDANNSTPPTPYEGFTNTWDRAARWTWAATSMFGPARF